MTIVALLIDMQRDYFAHERLARNCALLVANINQLLRVPVRMACVSFGSRPSSHQIYMTHCWKYGRREFML